MLNNNAVSFCDVNGLGYHDYVWYQKMLQENNPPFSYLSRVIEGDQSHPKPSCCSQKENKANNCVYFYFYYATDWKSKIWANNKRNNGISHVAISTDVNSPPTGFYPKGYILETRTDIASVVRCCCYSNSEMNQMKQYMQIKIKSNEKWRINGPNCATFANDTVCNKGTAKINANWRHILYQPIVKLTMNPFTNAIDTEIIGFSHKKYFPRPETLRQEVVQKKSCCKTIYSGR